MAKRDNRLWDRAIYKRNWIDPAAQCFRFVVLRAGLFSDRAGWVVCLGDLHQAGSITNGVIVNCFVAVRRGTERTIRRDVSYRCCFRLRLAAAFALDLEIWGAAFRSFTSSIILNGAMIGQNKEDPA